MDAKLKQKLDEAVDRLMFEPLPPAKLAEWVKGANPTIWYGVVDSLALVALAALIRARRSKVRIDSGQLSLPGFEHVPLEIGGAKILDLTLTEFRKRRQWFEAWLKGQQRRSREDSIRLTEMRRFERECGPFCAGKPKMTMQQAWVAMEEYRSSPSTKARRKGGHAKARKPKFART